MVNSFYKLFEGGNVFKDANKQPVTSRISKDAIGPSLRMVEEILGFKLDQWLGTTGKKDTSGDIDVSVDSSKHDKKEVANRLKAWAKTNGLKPGEWVKLSGDSVHFKLPIKGTDEFAQLDLMFGNPVFQSWSMRGEPGEYKGLHRHVILASIAKAQGMKWSYKNGLMDRATNKVISQEPKEIVRKVLPGYSGNPMDLNVESILNFIYKKYKNEPEKIEALIGEAAATLAEHYGVKLPMPNEPQVNESNDTDNYFVARLRDRLIELDMEPLIEEVQLTEAKMRAINHLEDLVLEGGPQGLIRAIKILDMFAKGKGHGDTTIKWDGSPAIVFGRDDNGQFILTDKSGWEAKGYDGKAKSAKELQQMLMNRKATLDAKRKKFISEMGRMYTAFEQATPKDFRGFMSGDLMYKETPPVQGGAYVFKPNVVEYRVNTKSKIGQRIGQSHAGIVVHKYIGNQYNTAEEAAKGIQGKEVFVIPPVTVQQPGKVDTTEVDQLKKLASSPELKTIFKPDALKGMSDLYHGLIYSYINQTVDVGLEKLSLKDFGHWVQGNKKLTDKKRERILAYIKEHAKGFDVLFTTIKKVMAAKDHLVQQFDSHPSDIQQFINGDVGGEGYVVKDAIGPVKLVSRAKFTAANRALHR